MGLQVEDRSFDGEHSRLQCASRRYLSECHPSICGGTLAGSSSFALSAKRGRRCTQHPRASEQLSLLDEVPGYDVDEFAGRDYLGPLPELGEMPLVAGDQIIGTGGIGALQKHVVIGVIRNL